MTVIDPIRIPAVNLSLSQSHEPVSNKGTNLKVNILGFTILSRLRRKNCTYAPAVVASTSTSPLPL